MKVQVLYKIFLWVNNTNKGTMRIFEVRAEKAYVDKLSEKSGDDDDDSDKSSDNKSNNHSVNKNPKDATVCRYLFTAKLLCMFRVS